MLGSVPELTYPSQARILHYPLFTLLPFLALARAATQCFLHSKIFVCLLFFTRSYLTLFFLQFFFTSVSFSLNFLHFLSHTSPHIRFRYSEFRIYSSPFRHSFSLPKTLLFQSNISIQIPLTPNYPRSHLHQFPFNTWPRQCNMWPSSFHLPIGHICPSCLWPELNGGQAEATGARLGYLCRGWSVLISLQLCPC